MNRVTLLVALAMLIAASLATTVSIIELDNRVDDLERTEQTP